MVFIEVLGYSSSSVWCRVMTLSELVVVVNMSQPTVVLNHRAHCGHVTLLYPGQFEAEISDPLPLSI